MQFILYAVSWAILTAFIYAIFGEPFQMPSGYDDEVCHDHCESLPCRFCDADSETIT